jgi:hypothetical protein
VLLSTRRAPRLTEAAISAYVFNTAWQSKGTGTSCEPVEAQSRGTCGVGWQHCHNEVCARSTFFGRCSGRASSGGELGHGVGADVGRRDAWCKRKHSTHRHLKSNPRTIKPPFTRFAAIGPPLLTRQQARQRCGTAAAHVTQPDESHAPAPHALHLTVTQLHRDTTHFFASLANRRAGAARRRANIISVKDSMGSS